MKPLKKLKQAIKKAAGEIIEDGIDGFACQVPRSSFYCLCIIVSWGKGWDHVSVHADSKKGQFTPFWEDMSFAKYLFFKPSETVVQYHPPKSCYINNHEHTLHLWRPQNKEIELPPITMV